MHLPVEPTSDLVINMLDGLTSYNSPKLDKYYDLYDDSFDRENEISNSLNKLFDTIVQIEPSAITETIFNRPPLFFSLLMALYSYKNVYDLKKISFGLMDIDARYNQDQKSPEDMEFISAVSATTQGEKQRKIRDEYIKKFIF